MNERYWMVRAGSGGFLFKEFIQKNIIVIGWNELDDLSKINSREEIKAKLFQEYQDSGVKAGLYAGILYKFVKKFRKGDKVITYNPINRHYQVGQIKSDYYFSKTKAEYFHVRDVEWLYAVKRDDLSQKTKNALGSVLTIFELKQGQINDLKQFAKEISSTPKSANKRLKGKEQKEKLFNEFKGECAYCKSKINDINSGFIEHFYPRNKYPELAMDEENLLYVCSVCAITKADKFPIDKDGYPEIINPRIDKWDEHITINTEGIAKGKTEKGKTTISLLNLNRDDLVENRVLQMLSSTLDKKLSKINKNYYDNFQKNMQAVRDLNLISSLIRTDLQYSQFIMLYGNAITNLETYLADALKNKVLTSRKHLRQFVETYKEFDESKFSISKLFETYDNIDDRVKKVLNGIMYHNLPKLKGIYKSALDVDFDDISFLARAVIKRHDFVHRGGKTVKGKIQSITQDEINELADKISEFVKNINEQIEKI